MDLSRKNILVTGGAGFIGSHLVESLLPDNEVVVVDNLSNASRESVPEGAEFHKLDLLDSEELKELMPSDADIVFHLAANSDIRKGTRDTRIDLKQNTVATYNVLEAMRISGVENIAFTSTSTVYGEGVPLPTPETFGPLEPISLYGASKLGCEGLCTAFSGTFGFRTWIYRFANIVGERGHGVVPDFIRKLKRDPGRLEILGNGEQRKSYLHVTDCVDAIIQGVENGDERIYNIGSEDTISVTRIAEIVSEEMGLDPEFDYTGGERGWKGDVPRMRLAIDRLKSIGWEPSHNSEESVRRAVREIL
ncbi:MAG: NAD-dependent epimerase/dehydratase family protein [Halobacteria archaeon]|nr:NAD-dependent epimerase/dehydratase family protein [Halobacteria archaeon]